MHGGYWVSPNLVALIGFIKSLSKANGRCSKLFSDIFLQCIGSVYGYLGFSLSGEPCPQGVQRLADHCSGARSQTPAHKVNSCRLAVICRRVVDSLS